MSLQWRGGGGIINGPIVHGALLWALWRSRRYYADGRSYGLRVKMLPLGLVIKETVGSPFLEADNIRFVAKTRSIPVPRILDVIEHTDDLGDSPKPWGIILMTRLEGEPLAKWISDHTVRSPGELELLERLDACITKGDVDGMSETVEKLKQMPPPTLDLSDAEPLLQDLRNALKELRSLEAPSPAVAGLFGRPLRCVRGGESAMIGPFEHQRQFKHTIFGQSGLGLIDGNNVPGLRRLAAAVNAKEHRICFTHADLAPRNVLIKDGRLSGIVDWECAGWYPDWNQPLVRRFWDAAELFGPGDPYPDEVALELSLLGYVDVEEVQDFSSPQ
ncbi:kinase-like domain-containing protein [Trametes punicea]|nr:kinase-like domain-containing protein [Trametes punicea]